MAGWDSRPQELLPATRIGRKQFIAADVGDKHVLMNVESGVYIGLDGVGKDIWERLGEPRTIAALCGELETAYRVPDPTVLERDVLEFIGNLRLHGLVEVLPPSIEASDPRS
jgi:hypothetical protein